jgi:hypothetical protein
MKMGLDIYIFKARNKKALEASSPETIQEVYYARKFWTLIQEASFLDVEEDCCSYIKLSRKNIEELIYIATHHEDYFGGFETVPSLCRILADFDTTEEEGYHYYMEFDY